MMKVLLIKSERMMDTDRWVVNPLGILSLASVARAAGHQVKLLDLRIEAAARLQRTLDEALADSPDVIGLSSLSHQARVTRRVAGYARRRSPDSLILAGGPLANTDPDYLLERAGVDACVLGEGETTFEKVLGALSMGEDLGTVAGLALKKNGGVTMTPPRELIQDVDAMLLPAWDMLDFDRYGKFIAMSLRRRKRASLQTSRGCPYLCTFCHSAFGKTFRGRTPGLVLDELKMLRRDYGVTYFELIDDIFNANRERAVAILEGIRDELPEIRITFPNALRADLLDREFIKLLKRAGCLSTYIAIETASERLQRESKKRLSMEKVRQAAKWLKEEGIHTSALFMVGFPGETPEEIEETFALARELPVDLPHISIVIPFKNTELGDQALPEERTEDYSPENLDPRYGYRVDKTASVSSARLLERSLKEARRRLLINPGNWYILWAEFRYRLTGPVALLYKIFSAVAPHRYRRELAKRSGVQASFLERSEER